MVSSPAYNFFFYDIFAQIKQKTTKKSPWWKKFVKISFNIHFKVLHNVNPCLFGGFGVDFVLLNNLGSPSGQLGPTPGGDLWNKHR